MRNAKRWAIPLMIALVAGLLGSLSQPAKVQPVAAQMRYRIIMGGPLGVGVDVLNLPQAPQREYRSGRMAQKTMSCYGNQHEYWVLNNCDGSLSHVLSCPDSTCSPFLGKWVEVGWTQHADCLDPAGPFAAMVVESVMEFPGGCATWTPVPPTATRYATPEPTDQSTPGTTPVVPTDEPVKTATSRPYQTPEETPGSTPDPDPTDEPVNCKLSTGKDWTVRNVVEHLGQVMGNVKLIPAAEGVAWEPCKLNYQAVSLASLRIHTTDTNIVVVVTEAATERVSIWRGPFDLNVKGFDVRNMLGYTDVDWATVDGEWGIWRFVYTFGFLPVHGVDTYRTDNGNLRVSMARAPENNPKVGPVEASMLFGGEPDEWEVLNPSQIRFRGHGGSLGPRGEWLGGHMHKLAHHGVGCWDHWTKPSCWAGPLDETNEATWNR